MYVRKLKSLLYYLFCTPMDVLTFRRIGLLSKVLHPLKINGGKNIIIGSRVVVEYKGWLQALPLTGRDCQLIIGSGTQIGHFCHIIATLSIIIEDRVLIADKVYISDNLHSFENVNLPINDQPIKQINSVIIGKGSWLGENVCVIGASIGRNSVIGANSVVTKDIPDYSVAVGSPAKVIKRYNLKSRSWEKTDDRGEFLT